MAAPKSIMEYFTFGDVGKRLVDPAFFQEALSVLMGWQSLAASSVSPGPLLSMRTNLMTGPTGSLYAQLPLALAGRQVTVINLASAVLNIVPQQYNPAIGGADIIMAPSGGVPIGSVSSYLSYQPGSWVLFTPGSNPLLPEEPEEPC